MHSHQPSVQIFLNKLITFFYRRMVVVYCDYNDPAPTETHPAAEVQQLTANDVEAYCRLNPHYQAAEFLSCIARGEQCFAIIYEARIAHVGWASTKQTYVPYLHCNLTPAEGTVYQYGNYTHPHYRRYGFSALRANAMRHIYQAQGCSHSIGLVAIENIVGLTAARSFGFTDIGLLGCWRFGPWRHHWQQAWTNVRLPLIEPSTIRSWKS
jgi:GNAT superfamily N-acetyltransferase